MFPVGTAGAALLVLRISVAATLLANGAARWPPLTTPSWIPLSLALLAICLCLGLFTPYCSAVVCLIQAYLLLGGGRDEFHLAISILDSGVLAVLGPGAYSSDARIFGRKRLTLPSRRKSRL